MRYNDAIATARIPTLADRREALCRSLFARMQQTNHKLPHLLPPPGTCNYSLRNARAYGVPRCKTNASRTLLCRMDCIIGSEWTSLFTHEHYWL
ncbi:hypothetical protein NP493_974g00050 [Ridgeia piscesae]|uniref:Uncharacterized protein n=1 Tax=Ridgeia piscesae TaxID=27915 RepID=A0AAD9KJ35_RIDPI|nr:hypothetical protein NP493_974g00050 [Ridgeia piscesae]